MAGSYSYPTKLAPVAADVATLATNLAQRQSDSGTTNGGIVASGGAPTVPQLGVDALNAGITYEQAIADCILAAVGYQQQNDQAGTGQTNGTSTFANVFASWSPTLPMAKTYLLHIDVSCYMTGSADQVLFQLSVTGGTPSLPANASKFYFNALSDHRRISFRVPIAFSSTSPTIQLQAKTTGLGTVHFDGTDCLCMTLAG